MRLFRHLMRSSLRGQLIFALIIIIFVAMLMSVWPSILDSKEGLLAKGADVTLEDLENGTYNLTWKPRVGVQNHLALASQNITGNTLMAVGSQLPGASLDIAAIQANASLLDPFGVHLLYAGPDFGVSFQNTGNWTWFWVAYLNDSGMVVSAPVSIANLTISGAFDVYLQDNPLVEGFLGNTDPLDFYTIEGFLAIEAWSWWPLVVAIYFGIVAGGMIARPVEERSIDLLLATGYTRGRFLSERLLVVLLQAVFLNIIVVASIAIGVVAVGETVPWTGLLLVTLGGVPFTLAVIALGTLASVYLDENRRVLGVVLGVMLGMYFLRILANLSDALSWLEWLSLFHYWDANSLLIHTKVDWLLPIIPSILSVVLFIWAYRAWLAKDIPA